MGFMTNNRRIHTHNMGCGCGALSTRRSFLAGAAAVGAASTFPGAGHAQGAARLLIDTHHHFYPPPYLSAWNEWDDAHKQPHFAPHAAWSRERAVEAMDKAGVRAAILSLPSTPGLWFNAGATEADRIARICNDYGAEMVRQFPGRFGLFATLPMVDINSTLKEIEYVFETIKADGVGLQSSYGDKWLGDPIYRPIFEELNRRKAVVYVHPVAGACCTNLNVGVNVSTLEVPFDTTRSIASLLLSGTLARTRDIRWLFSHAGGTIPMMAGRINSFYANNPRRAEFAPEGIEEELRKLYYDTANAAFGPNMAALMKFVPASRITYGTDYPYFRLDQINILRQAGITDADMRAIESGNAVRLIPRLRT
jgi:predicted TIM-barrel fold metal-dependent hydrolase